MNILRILGLDDDNHGYCWVCEDGTHFETTKEIMEFLAKPHDCQVELKLFAIVEDWSEELQAHDDYLVDDMFAFLEGVAIQPEGMSFKEVFNLFWESANRMHW